MLCLNSINNGAGINLQETTDIILYHKMSPQIETQIIGRLIELVENQFKCSSFKLNVIYKMSIIKFYNNKCCSFEIKNYTKIDFIPISKKAGVHFDIQNNKVLLVQSRGNLWGCPKGSVEPMKLLKHVLYVKY